MQLFLPTCLVFLAVLSPFVSQNLAAELGSCLSFYSRQGCFTLSSIAGKASVSLPLPNSTSGLISCFWQPMQTWVSTRRLRPCFGCSAAVCKQCRKGSCTQPVGFCFDETDAGWLQQGLSDAKGRLSQAQLPPPVPSLPVVQNRLQLPAYF